MPGSPARPTTAPEPTPGRGLRSIDTDRSALGHAVGADVADLVHEALIAELRLTPKPGLVDLRNTGSHRDMDVATFTASAAAIRPWFARFFRLGVESAAMPARDVLALVRPDGLACERAMFAATGGVNTHKGTIFAFGLTAAAAGREWTRTGALDRDAVCEEVAAITAGLVARELAIAHEPTTAGERIYRRHGLTGARGEAASGFATVRDGALPVLQAALSRGVDRDTALHAAFLHLLEYNHDTNLVARGGAEGARFARTEAARLRQRGGVSAPDHLDRLADLDDAFIARNLSPGGSADLLSLTWFFHRLPDLVPNGPVLRRC